MAETQLFAVSEDEWGSADYPLGAFFTTDVPASTTFAVFAPDATKLTLEFFSEAMGVDSHTVFYPIKGEDGVWRAKISGVKPGDFYGYRAWGENWVFDENWQPGNSAAGFISDVSESGNRFNPNKLLFDPYAREISHTPNNPKISSDTFDSSMFGTGGDDYFGVPRREFDTAKWAPKGIVIDDNSRTGRYPGIATKDRIIYEAHVKGLTKHPSAANLEELFDSLASLGNVDSVPDEYRGTYLGAAYLAPYLKTLGFTTIELLPVHETSKSDVEEGTFNYWGYETLGYFAPIRSYAVDQSPGGPTREFKQMVKAFHREGIEVYLDVVYNHSGEGGHWDSDLNVTGFTTLGGFACPHYYTLTHENRLVDGATGVSNTLNFSSKVCQQLVLDSLKYWHHDMGVDGFRFDLAPVLGRKPADADREDWNLQRRFFPDHELLTAIRDWAKQESVEVVAEAWDMWGYEVGNFPCGWGEWNGRYRDAVRKFLKGDGNTYEFIDMVNGDYQHFDRHGGPQYSVNFITAHDGFTLADLVSYNHKNNTVEPPFGPSDGGSDSNESWDSGGDHALRRQRLRNFWTILMISRGVPMVVAGDEYGRTQNGNNNPYAVDSVGIWQNWAQVPSNSPHQVPVDPNNPDISYHDNLGVAPTDAHINPIWHLASYLTNLRKSHPGLRQKTYGNVTRGDLDVSYLFGRPDGRPADQHERALRLLIDCGKYGGDNLLVLINMANTNVDFSLPRPHRNRTWHRIVDTSGFFESEGNCWTVDNAEIVHGTYNLAGWSVVVLREVSETPALKLNKQVLRDYVSRALRWLKRSTAGAIDRLDDYRSRITRK